MGFPRFVACANALMLKLSIGVCGVRMFCRMKAGGCSNTNQTNLQHNTLALGHRDYSRETRTDEGRSLLEAREHANEKSVSSIT